MAYQVPYSNNADGYISAPQRDDRGPGLDQAKNLLQGGFEQVSRNVAELLILDLSGKKLFGKSTRIEWAEGAARRWAWIILKATIISIAGSYFVGPKPLRVIGGLAGLALAVASALGLINVLKALINPAQFVLQIYEVYVGWEGARLLSIQVVWVVDCSHWIKSILQTWKQIQRLFL